MFRKAICLIILALLAAFTFASEQESGEPVIDNMCLVAGANGWQGLCQTEAEWTAGWYVFKHGWTWTWNSRPHLRGALSGLPKSEPAVPQVLTQQKTDGNDNTDQTGQTDQTDQTGEGGTPAVNLLRIVDISNSEQPPSYPRATDDGKPAGSPGTSAATVSTQQISAAPANQCPAGRSYTCKTWVSTFNNQRQREIWEAVRRHTGVTLPNPLVVEHCDCYKD